MNAGSSRHWAKPFAAALFVFAAGCAGAGSPPAPNAVAANNRVAHESSRATTPAFYVSTLSTSVSIYSIHTNPNAPQPLAVLTQALTQSQGLWVDKKGTLYVVNGCCPGSPPSVVEFARGQTAPSLQITNGLHDPGDVAVSSDGTVYVSAEQEGENVTTGLVVVYKRGQTSPERTISLPDAVYGLQVGSVLFDARGNVLVATLNPLNGTVHVFQISRGSHQPADTGIQGAAGDSLGLDAAGNLYAANAVNSDGVVTVYAPGATEPTRTYSLGPQIADIAVAPDGTLYATTAGNKGILEVAPGGSTVENTFKTGGAGIALGRY
jgi:sugar lactone lactonase YvrE